MARKREKDTIVALSDLTLLEILLKIIQEIKSEGNENFEMSVTRFAGKYYVTGKGLRMMLNV